MSATPEKEPIPEPASPPKRRRTWWWKIPLVLVGLLLILVVVLVANLSTIATRVANSQLPAFLAADASVGKIQVRLLQGQVSIHGLRVGQPDGFGDDALVELNRILAHVDLKSLTSGEGIVVKAVEIEDLKAHIVKDVDGILNVLRLVPPAEASAPDGEAAPVDPIAEAPSTLESSPETESATPPIRIERVMVSNVGVSYTDHSTGSRPVEIRLGDLGIELEDGLVELAEAPSVTLGKGSVTLQNIHIAQPDEFGSDPLLDLRLVSLDIGAEPFVDNVVKLQSLDLEGLRAHLIRNQDGVLNVARLGGGPPPPPPAPETAPAEGDEVPEESAVAQSPEPESSEASPPDDPGIGIYLGELNLKDFQVTYTDALLVEDDTMEFLVQDLNLNVKDIMAFLPASPVPASRVDLGLTLAQTDAPDARIALMANLGPVSAGVPDLNAQFKLTGLLLDTLGSLVPSGVAEALGAKGTDLQVGLALNATSIDLDGSLNTSSGHSYDLMVEGPLDQPKVDLGPLMFAVAGRVVGGVFNVAEGSAAAALDVAQGVTGGATELTKGATGLLGNLGGGLMKTAGGALRGDLDKVGEGVKGATTGAVKDAASAVGGAGGTVLSEAKEGATSATGGKRTAKWLDAVETRHEEDVSTARQNLEAMPFPPPALLDPPPES